MSTKGEWIRIQEALDGVVNGEGYALVRKRLEAMLFELDNEYHGIRADDAIRIAELQGQMRMLQVAISMPAQLLEEAIIETGKAN